MQFQTSNCVKYIICHPPPQHKSAYLCLLFLGLCIHRAERFLNPQHLLDKEGRLLLSLLLKKGINSMANKEMNSELSVLGDVRIATRY